MAKILMFQRDPADMPEVKDESIWEAFKEFLNLGLHIGEGDRSVHITIGLLLLLTISFLGTAIFLKWIRNFVTRNMAGEDRLKFVSLFKFIKYVVYLTVILLVMSAAGIDITLLITASAMLFVGIGLALQELFQDIIAGVYIIFDKSLRVGDVIEVESKVCRVLDIELRSTKAVTRDEKVMVIPNHKFMTDTVYNYTQNTKTTRESVTVGVAYGSDVNLVTRILLECAAAEPQVEKDPQAFVEFADFGDSALIFMLNFFTTDTFRSNRIKSRIRYMIDDEFRKHKVTIPFPQRDVHLFPTRPIPFQQRGEEGDHQE